MIFSVAYLYRLLLRGLISLYTYIYIYIYSYQLYIEFLHSILAIPPAVYRVGDNGRTVNTSTSSHISDQLGTENAGLTLFCWFIVMIWVLVCKNMYRYERYLTHFESFYRNPETVSVAGKWVGPHWKSFLNWNTTTGNNSSTDVLLR